MWKWSIRGYKALYSIVAHACSCVCVHTYHVILVLHRHHCSPPCTAELVYKRSSQPKIAAYVWVCVYQTMQLRVQPAQIYSSSPETETGYCSIATFLWSERLNVDWMTFVLLDHLQHLKLKCFLCTLKSTRGHRCNQHGWD